MVTLGSKDTDLLDDEWTVVTATAAGPRTSSTRSRSRPTGAWVLTALDGGEAALTALGVPFGGR